MFHSFKKWYDDWMWNQHCQYRYGRGAKHIALNYNDCEMVVWNEDEATEIDQHPNSIHYNRKLINEWKNAERNTVTAPDQYRFVPNIIVNEGLLEMGLRDTGESSSTNLVYVFGDDATPSEDVADTQLNNKVHTESFASKGERGMVTASRTGRYLMPVRASDYTGNIAEAGLATGTAPEGADELITHYTFGTITISALQIMQALTTIVYKNGTV